MAMLISTRSFAAVGIAVQAESGIGIGLVAAFQGEQLFDAVRGCSPQFGLPAQLSAESTLPRVPPARRGEKFARPPVLRHCGTGAGSEIHSRLQAPRRRSCSPRAASFPFLHCRARTA